MNYLGLLIAAWMVVCFVTYQMQDPELRRDLESGKNIDLSSVHPSARPVIYTISLLLFISILPLIPLYDKWKRWKRTREIRANMQEMIDSWNRAMELAGEPERISLDKISFVENSGGDAVIKVSGPLAEDSKFANMKRKLEEVMERNRDETGPQDKTTS